MICMPELTIIMPACDAQNNVHIGHTRHILLEPYAG